MRNMRLERYKIMETRAGAAWGINDEVDKARHDYDDGLIEMCTGRDGETMILYAIPRKVPVTRAPYFFSTNEGALA